MEDCLGMTLHRGDCSVQFGSSIYAPKHARDLDLIVFTKERKGKSTGYTDKLYELNLPYDIDVLMEEVGRG